MTLDLTERIATLETQLRQQIDRHNQARAVVDETQIAIHQIQGALALARELHATSNGEATG